MCCQALIPMPNGVTDVAGYMPLLESKEAALWWTLEHLTELGVDEAVNPYQLPNHHPVTNLRIKSMEAQYRISGRRLILWINVLDWASCGQAVGKLVSSVALTPVNFRLAQVIRSVRDCLDLKTFS